MGRRSNGEGTITRRKDGRWEARYYVPTLNGTKRKTIYGKTQAEVRDKLTKALSDRIDGIRATGVEALARGEGPRR
jgi:integrase